MAEYRVKNMLSGIDLIPGHLVGECRSKILDACFECPGCVDYLSQGCSGHSGILLCKY